MLISLYDLQDIRDSGSALAPPSDLVVHCEAQAFLEAVAGVHNVPPNVSVHL